MDCGRPGSLVGGARATVGLVFPLGTGAALVLGTLDVTTILGDRRRRQIGRSDLGRVDGAQGGRAVGGGVDTGAATVAAGAAFGDHGTDRRRHLRLFAVTVLHRLAPIQQVVLFLRPYRKEKLNIPLVKNLD